MTYAHRFAALLVLLLSGAFAAQALNLPPGATQIGNRSEAPARYAMPIAAYDGSQVPSQIVTGALSQTAWLFEGTQDNTLSLLQPLADQLTAQGFRTVFTCQTTECGGFDFRFGIDVLPEPQMHVDLGDFQYLAAVNPEGDATTLLVSRTADQGFVQITSISVARTGIVQTAIPSQRGDTSTAIQTPQPEIQPSPAAAPTDLEAALMTTGSVALNDLVFASGKVTLEDGTYPSLTALASWLKANPTMTVTLIGHTDASGSLPVNVALSKQRATAVREWLIRKYNAAATQIDVQGAGYLSPRATNQTPEGRAKNRRVEVMLTSTLPN